MNKEIMKNQVKKIIILAAFGLVVMALSACSTNTNNLLGAAGQPTETPTLQPLPETSPEPTLPPIPETPPPSGKALRSVVQCGSWALGMG